MMNFREECEIMKLSNFYKTAGLLSLAVFLGTLVDSATKQTGAAKQSLAKDEASFKEIVDKVQGSKGSNNQEP